MLERGFKQDKTENDKIVSAPRKLSTYSARAAVFPYVV